MRTEWTNTYFIFIPTTASCNLTMSAFSINRVKRQNDKACVKMSKFGIVKMSPRQTEPGGFH